MRKDKAGNELNEFGFRKDFNWETRFDLKTEKDGYLISTVDLGLDYSFRYGPPLYYETMIFKKNGDEIDFFGLYIEQYSTENEAREGHKRTVNNLEKYINGE